MSDNKQNECPIHGGFDCPPSATPGYCPGPILRKAHLNELELELRKFMWANHGHDGLYGDDGEMQCGLCMKVGCGDYKREGLDKVRAAFHIAKMKEIADIKELRQERDELQQAFDLEQSRVQVVSKEWQKAHGKPNVLPDLGMLIDWMWGQVKVCEFLVDSRKKPEVVLRDHHCPLCGNQLKEP